MQQYLENSEFIDHSHPQIIALALQLKNEALANDSTVSTSEQSYSNAVAQKCFEFVRDNIRHSFDYKVDQITCKASDVLFHKTGYCYAKSHLLAALLRANKIPAGLCYQRLSVFGDGEPYSLHGLNAVYLEKVGWYRIDARGNKEGVNANFCPPMEQLAFRIHNKNEKDIQGIWPQPMPCIVKVLQSYNTYMDVSDNLPDIESYD